MAKFNRDKKSSGGRGFGGRDSGGRGFGGRDSNVRPSMFKAVCDECGQSCEVPFRPTGDKPIYCNSCFAGKRGGDSRGSGEGRRERPSFGDRADRQMFSAVCSECGNKCEVPFRPTGDKPVYCAQCFEKNKRGGSGRVSLVGKGGDGQLRGQLDALNAKLDKILKILAPSVEASIVVKEPTLKPKIEIPVGAQHVVPEKKVESKKAIKVEKPVLKKEIIEEKKESKPEKKIVKKKVAAKKNPLEKLGAGK